MLKIFIGFDHRQPISYNVLQYSLFMHSSKPLAITPLVLPQLPIQRGGLTPFTFSRFLVPHLCDYEGYALFLDADMLALADIAELFDMVDRSKTVSVVKNEKAFERASLMLFNCELCGKLTPDYVETAKDLHRLSWCPEERIGELPGEWNHLVGYDEPRAEPKLIHYTQGVPAFPETQNCEHAEIWRNIAHRSMSAISWSDLMGNSVHAVQLEDGRKIPRLILGEQKIAEIMEAQANA